MAAKYYEIAAQQGPTRDAQVNLGGALRSEGGASRRIYPRKPSTWYGKAVEQGSAVGAFNLGELFRQGRGVDVDMAKAASLYRMAAERGFVKAQVNLGSLYTLGQGVEADIQQSYFWYEVAARTGDQYALRARDRVEEELTPEQIAAVRKVARQWRAVGSEEEAAAKAEAEAEANPETAPKP